MLRIRSNTYPRQISMKILYALYEKLEISLEPREGGTTIVIVW